MKYLSFIFLLFLYGCFSPDISYSPTNYYDIGIPDLYSTKGACIEINSITTAGVYQTKMVYRKNGSEVLLDEYNRWSQAPGYMLKHYLMLAFGNGSTGKRIIIDGSVLLFELNLDTNTAFFAIEYKLSGDVPISKKLFRTQVECSENSASALAQAMSEAMREFCTHLNKEIEQISKQ